MIASICCCQHSSYSVLLPHLQPVSVRKDSQENAEANKEAHNASSGNRNLGGDVPAPDDEEHIQVATMCARLLCSLDTCAP